LLARDDTHRFSLTPESAAFLVSDSPATLGPFFKQIATTLIPTWLRINEAVRSGRPSQAMNQEGVGGAFFEEFVESLFSINFAAASALGAHFGLAQSQKPVSVLDIAAGSGVWSIALARQSPDVKATAVDWPQVLPVTRRLVERHGLGARFRFIEGDILEADLGKSHDLAVLGHILHSEGEERSKVLLKRVHDALAPGGSIAIADFLVDPDRRGPALPLIFAVNMLIHSDRGTTWSYEEIGRFLAEAGFVETRQLDVPGPSPLILAERAR
jgi:SAM-dependent methyltransferase